jgi:hypothetical protein
VDDESERKRASREGVSCALKNAKKAVLSAI